MDCGAYATQAAKLVHNGETAEDLRVRRTRKVLQEALIALTVEKGFGAISVRDLTERAMVNRSTFYRHYLDKYDLLNQYMDEVYELVNEEAFAAEKMDMHTNRVGKGLMRTLEHIQTFGDFYLTMLGPQGDAHFIQRFRQNVERRFRRLMALKNIVPAPSDTPIDLRLSYISGASVGAIVWWLENKQPCSVEQLARWMGGLSSVSAGLPIDPSGMVQQE